MSADVITANTAWGQLRGGHIDDNPYLLQNRLKTLQASYVATSDAVERSDHSGNFMRVDAGGVDIGMNYGGVTSYPSSGKTVNFNAQSLGLHNQ